MGIFSTSKKELNQTIEIQAKQIIDLKIQLSNMKQMEAPVVLKDNSIEEKRKAIKNHLLTKGNITSWEAIEKFNATRLSADIFELKKKGMDITTTPESNGKSHFVRYHLNKAIQNN